MIFIWRKIVMKSGQAFFKRYFCFVNVRLKKKAPINVATVPFAVVGLCPPMPRLLSCGRGTGWLWGS